MPTINLKTTKRRHYLRQFVCYSNTKSTARARKINASKNNQICMFTFPLVPSQTDLACMCASAHPREQIIERKSTVCIIECTEASIKPNARIKIKINTVRCSTGNKPTQQQVDKSQPFSRLCVIHPIKSRVIAVTFRSSLEINGKLSSWNFRIARKKRVKYSSKLFQIMMKYDFH